MVERARQAGLAVILDMHNYGAYYLSDGTQGIRQPIGSTAVTSADFADVWRQISEAFRDDRGVLAFGLMNEPVNMEGRGGARPAQVWERASQSALDAIRSTGDTRLIMVAGYQWSGVQVWADEHPSAWIVDPLDNFRYEAHHYWDVDHSSLYRQSYSKLTGGLGPEIEPVGVDPFSWTPERLGRWYLPGLMSANPHQASRGLTDDQRDRAGEPGDARDHVEAAGNLGRDGGPASTAAGWGVVAGRRGSFVCLRLPGVVSVAPSRDGSPGAANERNVMLNSSA